jgi:starch synthase (maltosyl-transferring)
MFGIRFYYLHPLLAGPVDTWTNHLDRIAAMSFDAVIIAPPFMPGRSGDLFLTADHNRLDPNGRRPLSQPPAEWKCGWH